MLFKKSFFPIAFISLLIGLSACKRVAKSSTSLEQSSSDLSVSSVDLVEKDADKYFSKYSLSLENAEVISSKGVGSSQVDELFTAIKAGDFESVKTFTGGLERFFVAFVEKDNSSCQDLYRGLKTFQDKWDSNNAEFSGLEGSFKLITIYVDSTSSSNADTYLFDRVWASHFSFFEDLSRSDYLPNTNYAKNQQYSYNVYTSYFLDGAPQIRNRVPLLFYFDYTENNPISQQYIKGLSDIIFAVNGSTDLERAYTLRDCWSHTGLFGETNNQ